MILGSDTLFYCPYMASVLVWILQRNRTNRVYISIYSYLLYIKRFIIRNWLTPSWRLRSPRIYSWQAGDPRELSLEAGEDRSPSSKTVKQRQRIFSFSAFYSTQAFNGLDEDHPQWGGQSALLSLWIQILILF